MKHWLKILNYILFGFAPSGIFNWICETFVQCGIQQVAAQTLLLFHDIEKGKRVLQTQNYNRFGHFEEHRSYNKKGEK